MKSSQTGGFSSRIAGGARRQEKVVPDMFSAVGETPDPMYKLPGGKYRAVLR